MIVSKLCGRVGYGRAMPSLLLKRMATNKLVSALSVNTSAAMFNKKDKVFPLGDHAKMFKVEKFFSAASLPLIPISYFVHGHTMDYILIAAIVLNAHWGAHAVVTDYGRAIVIGEKLSAIAPKLIYVLSTLLLAGLLHFEYNDVGLTRAFELVFSL